MACLSIWIACMIAILRSNGFFDATALPFAETSRRSSLVLVVSPALLSLKKVPDKLFQRALLLSLPLSLFLFLLLLMLVQECQKRLSRVAEAWTSLGQQLGVELLSDARELG